VIISEVMANPMELTELPETEYVEIYNTSGRIISLNGWTFVYDNRAVALPDTALSAGSYAVLYRAGRDIFIESGGMNLPVSAFPSSLANTGKTLKIINSIGITIDLVDYAAAKPARSWERDVEGEFYLSNGPKGGTPGAANSPKELPPPPADPDNSDPGDVIINEIMANPVGLAEFPETEYVEIYNASGRSISLSGWTFIYDNRAVALPDTTLFAGSYAILYRAERDIFVESGGMNLPVPAFPSSLANTGKTLKIINSLGLTIDSVDYAEAKPARAWERDGAGYFYLSNDPKGGTPGAANSPKELPPPPADTDNSNPGDVIINEIMANPAGLTELPETEYVEICNASGRNISMNGWIFVYDNRAVALPDTTLSAGGYAVLYRASQNIFVESGGMNLPVATFPSSLANTGKTLKIINSTGMTIDSVEYAEARPARAWERDDDGNFYLSNDLKGGTPGASNSPKELLPPPANPDNSNPGDVIINEVMANPTGLTEFPETEYVEILNASDTDISLSGWTFVYDSRAVTLPNTTLFAGSYAVLYRAGQNIFVESGGVDLPVSAFPSSLANTGKMLKIINSTGMTIDSVEYAEARPARAWERDDEGYFYPSNDPRGGTPGAINSLKYIWNGKEIIFNEILPEPFEGGSEYIELYNRSEHSLFVFNLAIATRKSDGTLDTRYPLSSITVPVPPNGYMVLTASRKGVLDFYAASAEPSVYEVRLPLLNNTGSTLILLSTSDETVIDEVSYSHKWHDIAIKTAKGVALERIDPDAVSQDAVNWTSAISMVGYGTPGYRNSQSGQTGTTLSVSAPEYMPETNEYRIAYQVDQAGYRCRLQIFTLEGARVAEIASNQLVGTDGEIYWNGYGSDESRLHAGLYIFHAELYHPDGKRKAFKKAFLVRP
jgi:roadblock/LC7 domain-containing protein